MACAYIFLVLILIVKRSICSEPKCSSFDYDKQLLERMIEREYEFRQIRDEIKKTSADVNQGVEQFKEDIKLMKQVLDEFKGVQGNELSKSLEELKNDRSKMQLDITEYKKEISAELDAKESKLNEVFKQQQAMISRMSGDLRQLENETLQEIKAAAVQPVVQPAVQPAVSFRTSTTSGFKLQTTNLPIIFQTVDFNIGNAYDGTTGVFTTPVNGIYLFTVHICVESQNFQNIDIVVDDVRVTRSLNRAQSSFDCFTITDLINLTAGARVWIINRYNWSPPTLIHDNSRQCYFTGILV